VRLKFETEGWRARRDFAGKDNRWRTGDRRVRAGSRHRCADRAHRSPRHEGRYGRLQREIGRQREPAMQAVLCAAGSGWQQDHWPKYRNWRSPSKPVSIQLHNCNGAQISINLQPTGNVISASNSTFALTSGGATGVAIQMLNASGTAPLPLNQVVSMGTAGSPTALADFTVGMMARYSQIATTVTPGAANGTLQFVMSYQ